MDSDIKHMDREEVMNKFNSLLECCSATYLLDSILRAMSTDEAQQHLEWFCNDNDVDIEEL